MLKSLPASISSAVASGLSRHAEAQAAADRLAAIMADIHGGAWRTSVNHPRATAIIWQYSEEPVESGEKSS